MRSDDHLDSEWCLIDFERLEMTGQRTTLFLPLISATVEAGELSTPQGLLRNHG
jgi:hypothetical protein